MPSAIAFHQLPSEEGGAANSAAGHAEGGEGALFVAAGRCIAHEGRETLPGRVLVR